MSFKAHFLVIRAMEHRKKKQMEALLRLIPADEDNDERKDS